MGKLSIAILLQRPPIKQRTSSSAMGMPKVNLNSKVDIYPAFREEENNAIQKVNEPNGLYFKNQFSHVYLLSDGKLPLGVVDDNESFANAAKRILKAIGVEKFWVLGRKPIGHYNDNTYIMKAYATEPIDGEWVLAEDVPIENHLKVILSK
eukprot:NODE_262_length_12566_cov_0.133392.p8 type:complete len:151 gc:universal NODE_262_length_12566_cov_0.133392:3392-2940(-)